MSFGSQIIYKQLFQWHGQVRIPMIQRDYAQGRTGEEEIREEFLSDIERALRKPANDPELPLNLDFIYGSVEGDVETRFLPLDGQQRLTTLFLLHWYMAWRDDQWDEFKDLFQIDRSSRFAYSVRPSSNEFFDELVSYRPTVSPNDVSQVTKLISDQSWYFRSWRLDPTIQSVLCMLDAIHLRFASSSGLFLRLIDQELPAITFQLLDLKNFGLSDDLYIKMNARGKPLTEFETFKARYEQDLVSQFEGSTFAIGEQDFSVAEYVALRLDTAWTDLFWKHRDKKSNLYDGAIMNMFRAVALVTRSPDSEKYVNDISRLRNNLKAPSYTDFHLHGWLDERFTLAIIRLLDAWSAERGNVIALLPDTSYFNEKAIFDRIVSSGANLPYVDLVQFAAYAGFVMKHHEAIDAKVFQAWMRIVHNLSVNTEYNRPDDFRRSIFGLNNLLEHSEDVLAHFAENEHPVSGFNQQQIDEEKLKIELMSADDTWKLLIDRAETHGYFRGQIEFLLDFSGALAARSQSTPDCWEVVSNTTIKENFLRYQLLAEQMFNASGLSSLSEFLWQRALLSVGDYLLPSGRNLSFLVNSTTDYASWKRLLKGSGETASKSRKVLHQLWDQLTPISPLKPQLEEVLVKSFALAPWRAVLVKTPSAIEYCKNLSIRRNSPTEIYLLRKIQMNGAHAELFTFCLYTNSLKQLDKDGQLKPLKLHDYFTVAGSDTEPGIHLSFRHGKHNADFYFELHRGQYVLYVLKDDLVEWPELLRLLIAYHFTETTEVVERIISFDDIETELLQLAQYLSEVFPGASSND